MATMQIKSYLQKKVHEDTIVAVRYSPTGRYLVSADQGGQIALWPEGCPRGLRRAQSPCSPLTGIWFSEDEQWLLAGHQDGYLVVYGLPKLKPLAEIRLDPGRSKDSNILSGTSRPVLDWVVLAACPSGDPSFYAVLEFRDFFTIRRADFQVTDHRHIGGPLLEYSASVPARRLVFFGDELGYVYRSVLPDSRLHIFAMHHEVVPGVDSARRRTTVDTATGIAGLALRGDGRLLASTSRTGGVQIWRTERDRPEGIAVRELPPAVARTPVRDHWIRGVCFVPSSTALVLGADDGTVEVWDYKAKHITHTAQCGTGVRSIDFSPDGSQLAVGCEDGSLFLVPRGRSPRRRPAGKPGGGWLGRLVGR